IDHAPEIQGYLGVGSLLGNRSVPVERSVRRAKKLPDQLPSNADQFVARQIRQGHRRLQCSASAATDGVSVSVLLILRLIHVWLVLGLIFAFAWDGLVDNNCNRRLDGGPFVANVIAWPLVALAISVDMKPACTFKR